MKLVILAITFFLLCLMLPVVKLNLEEDAFLLSGPIESGFLNISADASLFYWLIRHNSTSPSNKILTF